MVNAGAIATQVSCRARPEAKWNFIHDGLSRFAGRKLPLNEEVYACASQTNFRNQSVARLLQSYGRIYFDPAQATDLYTKQCSLNVSAKDLAVMGATLAEPHETLMLGSGSCRDFAVLMMEGVRRPKARLHLAEA
jgi:glutaminase